MREYYLKLRLLRPLLIEGSDYSETPDGDLDLDRLISSKPAFRVITDTQNFKQKKIILNDLSVPSKIPNHEREFWKIKIFMLLRQMINDGFEIYQYDKNGVLNLLTSYTVSKIFKTAESQYVKNSDSIRQDISKTQKNITFDDIAIFDTNEATDLAEQLPEESKILCASDIMQLSIFREQLKTLLEQGAVQGVVENISGFFDERDHALGIQWKTCIQSTGYSQLSPDIDLKNIEFLLIDKPTRENASLDVYTLLTKTPKIRELFFNNSVFFDVNKLCSLKLKNLESLEISSFCSSEDIKKILKNFPKLKTLRFTNRKLDLSDDMFSCDQLTLILNDAKSTVESLSIKSIKNFLNVISKNPTLYLYELNELNLLDSKFSGQELLEILDRTLSLSKIIFSQSELDFSEVELPFNRFIIVLKSAENVKKITLGNVSSLFGDRLKSNPKIKLSNLEEIDLSKTNFEIEEIITIIRKAPKLKKIILPESIKEILIFSNVSDISCNEMQLILSHSDNIDNLLIKNGEQFSLFLTTYKEPVLSVKHLLILDEIRDFETLHAILIKFPNIKSLSIQLSTDFILLRQKPVNCETLEDLIIKNCTCSTKHLEIILDAIPQLKKISLSLNLSENSLDEYSNLFLARKNLVEIHLSESNITINYLRHFIQKLSHVEIFRHNMSTLDLSNIGIDINTFKKILEHNHQFIKIKLSNPEQIQQFFQSVQNGLVKLEFLREIDFCDNPLTTEQFDILERFAPSIEEIKSKNEILDLRRHEQISEKKLLLLLKNASQCQKIFFGKNQVTPKIIEFLKSKNFSYCDEVDLSENTVEASDIISIIGKMPKLKKISHSLVDIALENVTAYTSIWKLFFKGNEENIRSISLKSCSDISYLYSRGTAIDDKYNFKSLTKFKVYFSFFQYNSILKGMPNLTELEFLSYFQLESKNSNDMLLNLSLDKLYSLAIVPGFYEESHINSFLDVNDSIKFLNIFYVPEAHENIVLQHPEKRCDVIHSETLSEIEFLALDGFIGEKRERLLLDQAKKIRMLKLKDVTISFTESLVDDSLKHMEKLVLVRTTISAEQYLDFLKKCPNLTEILIFRNNITGSEAAKKELSQFLTDFSKKHKLSDLEDDFAAMERLNQLPPPKITVATSLADEAHRKESRDISTSTVGNDIHVDTSVHRPHSFDSDLTCDANTTLKETTFDINRIFYAVGASGRNPEPANYRLAIYGSLKIESHTSHQSDAFLLGNTQDLKLESCEATLSFSSSDVYKEAIHLQKEMNNTFFYAKTKLLLSDRWQALPSLSNDEIIRKIHLEPAASVEVQYSKRDNLYYIRSKDSAGNRSIDIDYLVEVPDNKKTQSSQSIQKLTDYISTFHAAPLDMSQYIAPTGQDYLVEMARQKVGACRHRSVLFKALIENKELRSSIPELAALDFTDINVRIITNVSHAYVEVEENGAWVKYDLGGYPAHENINDDNNPLLKKENLEAIDEYSVDKNSDPHEIEALLQNASHLTKLSIDASFSSLSLMEGPTLEHLQSLDLGNRTLTITEMEVLLEKLPQLKEIRFNHCGLFSNEEIDDSPHTDDQQQSPVKIVPVAAIRQYFPTTEKHMETNPLAYAQSIFSRDEPKRLIECSAEQVAGLAYYLQHYCQHTGKRYCYINTPDELILRRAYLELQKDNSGKIKKGLHGRVYEALLDETSPVIFIVNFANFSAHDLARFNSILDKEANIDGVPLPKEATVVGIIDASGYKDASLYSRFGEAVEACSVPSENLTIPSCFSKPDAEKAEQKTIEIDFFGASNWQAILIGAWRVNGKNLRFNSGILVTLLENKTTFDRIVLKNPPINDPEFTRFFQEASLRGYIEYQGRRLAWPSPILTLKSELVFSTNHIVSVQCALPTLDSTVINPSTLSRFLKQYHFIKNKDQENGQLFEEAGILEKNKGKTLSIYVSENLSDSQWSLLLNECKKNSVNLDIRLASSVKLPSALHEKIQADITSQEPALLQAFSTSAASEGDCCIISDDRDITLSALREDIDNIICIDITELSSSDLLIKLKGGFEENTAKISEENLSLAFFQENGALLKALGKSKKVVLHGNFTPELRHRLQVFLFDRKQTTPSLGQVILVSDQKTGVTFDGIIAVLEHSVSPAEKKTALFQYVEKLFPGRSHEIPPEIFEETLPYVTQQALVRHHFSLASKEEAYVGLKTDLPSYQPESDFDLATAETQTTLFNKARLDAIEKTLATSPFVFLAGMTGVGKTSFVEKAWKNSEAQRSLYIGEKQLSQWANDTSPGIKAIFIDEANITSNNWSQFEGLFHNKPPGMVINGEYVVLSDQHKVIFAGNPVTYSDDRTLPSLFERHGNSIVFDPLSPAYIYHEILKPLFKTDNENALAEIICRPILMLYQYLNGLSKEEVLLTPRELTMMVQLTINHMQENLTADPKSVSSYFAYELSKQFVPREALEKFNNIFSTPRPEKIIHSPLKEGRITITESNKPSAEILSDFLILRKSNIESHTRMQAPGLGGVLLEGEPGLGKSELAVACLKAQGLKKRSLDAVDTPADQNYFYHIPAAADPKIKREILLRAFHEGVAVLYDEINTSTAQEDLLNRLLMGKDPDGNDPRKAGFMLIGTQNPTTMAGRAKTSNALLHRMHYRVIPHYTAPEMHMILKEIGLPERRINALISQYQNAISEKKAVCFRDVITRAEEDIRALLGKTTEHINKADLLKIASDAMTNYEQLESVFGHALCDDQVKLAIVKNNQASNELLEKIFSEKENRYSDEITSLLIRHPNTSERLLITLAAILKSEEMNFLLLKHPNADKDLVNAIIELTPSQAIFNAIIDHHSCTDALFNGIIKITDNIDLLGKIVRKEKIGPDVLLSVLEKTDDPKIWDWVLKNKNCNLVVLEKMTELSSNENILNAIALHSKSSANILLTIFNKNEEIKAITVKLILLNPNCDCSVLLKILEKTEDIKLLENIISHQSSDAKVLVAFLKKTTDEKIRSPELIEKCLKKLHQLSSLPSIDEIIKTMPHILYHVIPYLKNEKLIALAQKIDDPVLLNRISEKLDTSSREDFKRICLERDVKKPFNKEIFTGLLDQMTLGESYAFPIILEMINKSNDSEFLIQLIEKVKKFFDKPDFLPPDILDSLVKKCITFSAMPKSPLEKEMFNSLLVAVSKSVTTLSQVSELVQIADSDKVLEEIINKLAAINTERLDTVHFRLSSDIANTIAKNTKSDAIFSKLLDLKNIDYIALIKIIVPKVKDKTVFLKICMKEGALLANNFGMLIQHIDNANVLKKLLDTYDKSGFDIKKFYINYHSVNCNKAFIKMASASDFNETQLDYIFRHEKCTSETLTTIFKNRSDTAFTQEQLILTIDDKKFYSNLEKKPGFFEKKVVSKNYPTCTILAALLLIKLKYQGEHVLALATLIQKVKTALKAEDMVQHIEALVNSGTIGKMGGSGRLRKLLSEIVDSAKNNAPIKSADILKVLPDMSHQRLGKT